MNKTQKELFQKMVEKSVKRFFKNQSYYIKEAVFQAVDDVVYDTEQKLDPEVLDELTLEFWEKVEEAALEKINEINRQNENKNN